MTRPGHVCLILVALYLSQCAAITQDALNDLRSDIIDEMLKENSEALATGHNLDDFAKEFKLTCKSIVMNNLGRVYYLQYIQLIVEGGLESIKVEAQNILNGLELAEADYELDLLQQKRKVLDAFVDAAAHYVMQQPKGTGFSAFDPTSPSFVYAQMAPDEGVQVKKKAKKGATKKKSSQSTPEHVEM